MGIPRKYFVHRERVSDELVCPVCMEVPLNLVRTFPCQHIFCDSCLRTWMQEKAESCPQCRTPLKSHQIQRDRILNNIIGAMDVECRLCDSWAGPCSQYQIHHRRCQRAKEVAALSVRQRSRRSSDNDSVDSQSPRSDAGSGEADLLFSAITQERKLNLSRLNPIDYIAFLWWILSGSRKTTNVEQKSRIRLSSAVIQVMTWLPYFVVSFAYGTGTIACHNQDETVLEPCGSFSSFLPITAIIAVPMVALSFLLRFIEKEGARTQSPIRAGKRGTTIMLLFPAVHMFIVIVLLHGTSHLMRMFVFFAVTLSQNAVVTIQRFCCAMTDGKEDPMEILMWTNFFSTAAVTLSIIGGISGDVKYAIVFFISFGISLVFAVVFALAFRDRKGSWGALFYAGAIGSYVGALYGTSMILNIPLPYHSWLDIIFRLLLAVFSFSVFVILPIRPSAQNRQQFLEAFRIPASKSQKEWFSNDFRLSRLGFWLLAATYVVLAQLSGIINGPLLVLVLITILSVTFNTEAELRRMITSRLRRAFT